MVWAKGHGLQGNPIPADVGGSGELCFSSCRPRTFPSSLTLDLTTQFAWVNRTLAGCKQWLGEHWDVRLCPLGMFLGAVEKLALDS